MATIPITQKDKHIKNLPSITCIKPSLKSLMFIPNSDSRAFFSMDVKFRSRDQHLYESKLNSLAVILFPINNDNNNNITSNVI